jgi:hypothetical protein
MQRGIQQTDGLNEDSTRSWLLSAG